MEGDEAANRDTVSHPHKKWDYRFETLAALAGDCGLTCRYIGDRGHERNQKMALPTPKAAERPRAPRP